MSCSFRHTKGVFVKNHLFGLSVIVFTVLMIVSTVCAYAQDAVYHNRGVGTIVVKGKISLGHGKYGFVPTGATAAGFATDDCDFVTTFAVVEEYERSSTWKVNRENMTVREKDIPERMLEVTMSDGRPHRGELRPLGYFPLGLNLACVDFDSAPPRESKVYRLSLSTKETASLGQIVPPGTIEGTPIFNEIGKVISMYASNPYNPNHIISADELLVFLGEVKKVPRSRPLLLTPSLELP